MSDHLIFQQMRCPVCGINQNHVQEAIVGDGQNSYGASAERVGVKILMQCESGDAWILGVGEHKGDSFIYAREPHGGEVDATSDYLAEVETLDQVSFSGRSEPLDWTPSRRDARQMVVLDGSLFV